MNRKPKLSRSKYETGSAFFEIALELVVYIPRLFIRAFKWILN
ncbi:hypothetical protein [Paenibacillus sp. NPDC058071]